MARKYNDRGSFEGLKVELDGYSGEVNLRIPFRDLREVLTAAALNCMDSLEKSEKSEGGGRPADVAYHKGLHAYIRGIDTFLTAQLSPEGGTRTLAVDPLTRHRTVKERRETIKRAQDDRKMFDSMFALLVQPAPKKAPKRKA